MNESRDKQSIVALSDLGEEFDRLEAEKRRRDRSRRRLQLGAGLLAAIAALALTPVGPAAADYVSSLVGEDDPVSASECPEIADLFEEKLGTRPDTFTPACPTEEAADAYIERRLSEEAALDDLRERTIEQLED